MPKTKKPLNVCLVSLGCPKNLIDSEKMLATLAAGGCIVAVPMDKADVIVINTCAFLAAARDESLEVIAEALEAKRSGRAQRVVVAGCLPTRDGKGVYELAAGIDAIVGVNNRQDILAAVMGKRRFTRLDAYPLPSGRGSLGRGFAGSDAGRFRLTPRHTAFLRIAEGCSQRCSYCTVPAIRGPFRSKPPEAVLAEARELIADGAVELNLIAQNTTAYGQDFDDGTTLALLLRKLNALNGAKWIRLMYTYPRRFTDELIDAIAECEHVVPYVDIPLQHICDPILKRMRRGVTRKAVETLLGKLRKRVEGIVLRTTFIVGFPGESDQQFEELLEFVEEVAFEALGVFKFSPEEGTAAARMPNQIPDDVKADRAHRLMLAQQRIALTANESVIDSPITVLVDGTVSGGRCVGRYYGQAPEIDSLCILTRPQKPGTFVRGKVAGYEGYDLIVQDD